MIIFMEKLGRICYKFTFIKAGWDEVCFGIVYLLPILLVSFFRNRHDYLVNHIRRYVENIADSAWIDDDFSILFFIDSIC